MSDSGIHFRSTAFDTGLALLVVFIGILGLFHDSWAANTRGSWINIHALFGALLWASVIVRFYGRVKHSRPMPLTDIAVFSRQLSRMVYLLLYILLGIHQIICCAAFMWRGGTTGMGEDLRSYLGYGLIALITIHVLAARCRHFAKCHEVVREPPPRTIGMYPT